MNFFAISAHPHASWERGANENINGLIRQYFRKNTDFTVSEVEGEGVMRKLNNRPCRRRDYQAPWEVFFKHSGVALAS